MSKKALALLVLLVAGIGGGLYWFKAGPGAGKGVPWGSAAQKEVYYCPMHPTYQSDRPGDCPICNMRLVKRSAEKPQDASPMAGHEGSHEGSHSGSDKEAAHGSHGVPGATPRAFSVKEIMSMKPGEICLLHKCRMGNCTVAMTEEFARLGKCPMCGEDLGVVVKDALPRGYAQVAVSHGKQQLIGIKTAPVQKQKLVKIIRSSGSIAYDPELYQAQVEHSQNMEALDRARSSGSAEMLERAHQMAEASRLKLKLMGLANEMVQELESVRKADPGLLYGDPGGSVWLYAPIYEYEIPLVKIGDTVRVELPALPEKKFEGKIRSIDPVLDPVTRSIRIRAQLANPDGTLKPQMYVNAVLEIDLGEHLAVSKEAVFSTGDKNIVFVSKSDGIFEPREIVLGASSDVFSEVKSGLGEGEIVVTSGNFLIDSESRLKGALEDMSGTGHQHGQ